MKIINISEETATSSFVPKQNWPHALFIVRGGLLLTQTYAQVVQTPASEEQRRRAQEEAPERQRLAQELNVELLTKEGRGDVSWFGGDDGSENRPADAPTFQYALQTVDANLNLPFKVGSLPLTYVATLCGQTTQSALYLADQFAIGGRYTVGGFDGELTLTAECGFYLRNELNIPIANSSHSTYLGLDVGKVFGPSVQFLVGDKLAGAALGMRGSYHNISYDLFFSRPIYRLEGFVTTIPQRGI